MSRSRIGFTIASIALLGAPALARPERCGTPARPSRGVVVTTVWQPECRPARSTYADLVAQGWEQFECACYADAQRLFGRASRLRPSEAEANVGYALASAMCGDDRAAVWAMRDAFDCDPEGVRAPNSGAIDEALCDLRDRYTSRGTRHPSWRRAARDEAFMLGAVSYLMGDDREALRAVECAIERGDRSNAAYNLRDLLRRRPGCD